jgi:co-chaperonin GroES (HSP10)
METMEQTLYAPLLEGEVSGVEHFDPEDFQPCVGTVLVILPPPVKMTEGGIHLPDDSFSERSVAKVVAVPSRDGCDKNCPCNPGDFVVFREKTNIHLPFQKRKDLAVLNYCEGMESDILGVIPADKVELASPFEELEENDLTGGNGHL